MYSNVRTIPAGKLHFQFRPLLIGLALACWFAASGLAAAATWCVNPGGTSGCKSTISAAVAAAGTGDTIVVWPGTYKEQVTITKSVSLIAAPGASPVIDAAGKNNGIFINGMWAAPHPGVTNVLISGFSVHNANYEGILAVNAANVSLVKNHVFDNNLLVDIDNGTCPGIPAFETNEGDDCGEGIHLMGVLYSSVVDNESDHNTGGILITDETGASRDNLISTNNVHDNPFDCGITLASHPPATSVIPSAKVSFGVIRNTIAHNSVVHNGAELPGAGAGVGLFAAIPGTTTTENVVIDNDLTDNGLPGVTLHSHVPVGPSAPPINLNGNIVVGNRISGNGKDTEDAATSGPTGINVYSVVPVIGMVISQNVISDEAIDIAFKASASELNVHLNDFNTTGIGIQNLGAGAVNATFNWWNCAAGPGGKRCASISGPRVSATPWLTSPFAGEQ